jgi:extracellular elastinolytic metalloproteinase
MGVLGLLVLGLLGSTAGVAGHQIRSKQQLGTRVVDLNQYRLPVRANYVNATETSSSPHVALLKRGTYVDTATELLKSVVPGVTFRLVSDHYVGSNGVAHVYFKQTAHGLDIDNADFNVNVSV